MRKAAVLSAVLAVGTALQASADQVFTENVIIDNRSLCVGADCVDGEPVIGGDSGIKLKSSSNVILFEDISGGSFAGTDWLLKANELGSGGLRAFFLEDVSGGTRPFTIRASTPDNALYVNNSGFVGLGTSLPLSKLHIVSNGGNLITLEDTLSGSNWSIRSDTIALRIGEQAGGGILTLEEGAPLNAIRARFDGKIGFGLVNPEGKIHARGDGVQLFYFESGDGGPVQVRFRTDSENRRFLAVDNDNNVKSQIIFLDDRINFTGQTDSGANLWLSIGPDGITSQGPTCGSPCDLVFEPEAFTVPPIEDRAAYMWEHRHLPAVGPTSPDTPINLTEKMGGVIHELEVAHIYIEQLHDKIAQLEMDKARQHNLNARLLHRLDALEKQ